MKIFKKILFILLIFYSPSAFSSNLNDFRLEGFSLGQNLLDYLSKEEIDERAVWTRDHYRYLKHPNKYSEIYIRKRDFQVYDRISVMIMKVNRYISNKNDYKIRAVRGHIDNNDLNKCIRQRDKIYQEIFDVFPESDVTERIMKHPIDPSGKSIVDRKRITVFGGYIIDVNCKFFEETLRKKNNYVGGLEVAIFSPEIYHWMTDY